jgi:hypothetical protein
MLRNAYMLVDAYMILVLVNCLCEPMHCCRVICSCINDWWRLGCLLQQPISIKVIKYVNIENIQEIDDKSQQNPTDMHIKFSTVAAEIIHTSPEFTCHKNNIKS